MNDEKGLIDRKLAHIRASLLGRLHEVERRVSHAKRTLDPTHLIRTHPVAALGVGVVAGLYAGRSRTGEHMLHDSITTLVTGIVLQLVRSRANTWLAQRIVNTGVSSPA